MSRRREQRRKARKRQNKLRVDPKKLEGRVREIWREQMRRRP